MHELCERIVATRTVCAESSLYLVLGRPDLGEKNKAALGSQGTLSLNSFYRAGASRLSAALMLEIRAQNVPWSPRQPLLALESTRREAYKGTLCTATLTKPLQLESYFKNGNAVPGWSSQPHAHRRACPESRSPRVEGVPILVPKDLQDQVTFAALKRRWPGHAAATARLSSVWFGVARHRGTAPPRWPAPSSVGCSELSDVTVFRPRTIIPWNCQI